MVVRGLLLNGAGGARANDTRRVCAPIPSHRTRVALKGTRRGRDRRAQLVERIAWRAGEVPDLQGSGLPRPRVKEESQRSILSELRMSTWWGHARIHIHT